MSITQTTTLPSISHLLNGHPSSSPPLPPRLETTPAFNLSPASPISSHPPSSPPSLVSSAHSPQSSNNDLLHPLSVNSSSPLLSPVDSCKSPLTVNALLSPRSIPATSVSVVDDLPPLQGYDPPVRKFSSTNTLHPPPQIAPWSSRDNINHANTNCTLHVPPPPASPISNATSSRNNSITSNTSSSNMLSLPSPAMSPCQEKKQPSRSMRQQQQSSTPAPPSTQIIISPTGQPILKRRRGRPPSNREPQQEGGWTFLTPTVWDVKQTATPVIGTCASSSSVDGNNLSTTSSSANGTLTSSAVENNDMQGSMAAFTSSTMETVLQMPRKKRGRKPKTHIEGNSCFVWRDLPCTRSPSRSSKKIKRSE